MPGESDFPLLTAPPGPRAAGRRGNSRRGNGDPRCEWAEEAEVPARSPDSLQ